MDEITNISTEATIRYFTTLSLFGYKNNNDTNKLLVLLLIEELLTSEFSQFINEEDYKTIINSLYCLIGSTCMIDFPIFETYDSLVHGDKRFLIPRSTEDSILRVSELDLYRVEE